MDNGCGQIATGAGSGGHRSPPRARLVVLALLTVASGWLRFSATSFGLPDKFRPDEEYMVSRALGFERDWNPHFAIYPAAQMYLQHAALAFYAWALAGERGNFRAAYGADNQALAFLVARRLSAAMGTAAVPALYLAGAEAFGMQAALAAAAIMGVVTIAVRDSKYATADAAATLWVSLGLWMLVRMITRGRRRDFAGAGFFAGLAAATKYPAGVIAVGIAAAHLGARRREGRPLWRSLGDHRLYLAAGTAAITFLCATPYLLLDPAQTLGDYRYQRGFLINGVGNRLAGSGWSWLLLHAMPDSFGVALQVLLIVALGWAVLRHKPATLSLFAFITAALFGVTRSHYVFYRYILIPLPAMALLGGSFVADLAALASARLGTRHGPALAAAALAALLIPSLVRDLQLNRLLLTPDTRSVARRWIAAHVPAGSAIAATDATTPYGKPQLPGSYRMVPFTGVAALRARGVQWVLSDSLAPLAFYSRGPTNSELAALNSNAALVFDLDPVRAGAPAPVFDAADAFYAPLRHITSIKQPGPRIRIWKLN